MLLQPPFPILASCCSASGGACRREGHHMSLASETEPLLANERERRDEECGPYLSANHPRAGGRVDAIDGLRPLLALLDHAM